MSHVQASFLGGKHVDMFRVEADAELRSGLDFDVAALTHDQRLPARHVDIDERVGAMVLGKYRVADAIGMMRGNPCVNGDSTAVVDWIPQGSR